DASPRTQQYESRLSTTFRPKLDKIGVLDWISLQDVNYSAVFSWRNGALGSNTGATAGSSVDLRTGITMRPAEFWQKFGFKRALEKQQQEYEAAKQRERQQRQREREERKRRRAEEREVQRQQEAAEMEQEALEPQAEADAEETD